MKYVFVLITLLIIGSVNISSAQDDIDFELSCQVNINYPPLAVSRQVINEAETLVDLNRHYKPSWVKEYISVEVKTIQDGAVVKAVSTHHTLSSEQKENMKMADYGQEIHISVHYIPDNTLKHNEPKEYGFSFLVHPETEATFPGGQGELQNFIMNEAISKIQREVFTRYKLAAYKFTVNEVGHVVDAHVYWSSDDEATDKLMMETICNMPTWIPAKYADGTRTNQEFALTIGDEESCVTNLLNTGQGVLAKID